ncbi:NFACT RNA binding domain-containing protein [Desulfovibrio sp. OttesenSCG-928-O18]|nr:NFACT RNA binding domain-containing protein [Desulfovibrio sp. OttesenSCG-928-O18]
MDAHVFRHIARILAGQLTGARLERIHEPVPGITAFSLFAAGTKKCLLFRPHRSAPLCFLTARSPLSNPAFPPASVMRLRKYAEGRILGKPRIDWIERQLAFALPGPETPHDAWLLLDCKHGPAIVRSLPETFGNEPAWPDSAAIAAPAPWETFQVLTPQLRRALEPLDPMDAAALLVDLEDGNGDLFWYGKDEAPLLVSAWPLRPEPGMWEKAVRPEAETILPLLESLQMPLLLAQAKHVTEAPEVKKDKSAHKKRQRLLANLDQEKKRLEAMLLLGDDARLIQTHLWKLPPEEALSEITLPLDAARPDGECKTIALNPFISVSENMQTMFRKAAKAARGLGMLEKRFALAREIPASPRVPQEALRDTPKKNRGKKPLFSPSVIQEFVSSDGFVLWRGRSAEGNKNLLKLARPFDLWCHVEDGPSAHLLVRRDHAAQEVPESTLLEAAALVGLKSWRKDDPKAPVMFALAKHVHPVKGAGPGTVRVQERLQTLVATLDPALEARLKNTGATPASKANP